MKYRKVYVDVTVFVTRKGKVYPRQLRYEDGTVFRIEQVMSVWKNAASVRVGGQGDRYRVKILGRETDLYAEDNGRWFVEAKVVA